MTKQAPKLVLASSSPYRKQLLSRLGVPFSTSSPDIDESPLPAEDPLELAARLAEAKAAAVAKEHPQAIIIGSDQVAAVDNRVLGKPGDHEHGLEQLQFCSGKQVNFYTSVCLISPGADQVDKHTDITSVHFRKLNTKEIIAYLDKEQPWNCAGSFKSEGLGVCLFERIDNSDPTALIGLPLIWLSASLQRAGLILLA